jgi:hypothetical protein
LFSTAPLVDLTRRHLKPSPQAYIRAYEAASAIPAEDDRRLADTLIQQIGGF